MTLHKSFYAFLFKQEKNLIISFASLGRSYNGLIEKGKTIWL